MPKRSSASRSTNSADADWQKRSQDATKMANRDRETVINHDNHEANRDAVNAVTVAVASGVLDFVGRWCHESTKNSTSLPLILETSSGAERHDAAPAQLIQALSFPCQDHWMLEKRHFYRKPGALDAFLCFPDRMEQKHSASERSSLKICCDDTLGPYEFRTHAFWQRDEGFPLAEVFDLQQGG